MPTVTDEQRREKLILKYPDATEAEITQKLYCQFPTPTGLSEFIAETVKESCPIIPNDALIFEPGCGTGSFILAAREVWPESWIFGVDIDETLVNVARARIESVCEMNKVEILPADFLACPGLEDKPDLIIGNPPFVRAEEFIDRSLNILSHDGVLCFLLRMDFLGGVNRYETLWSNRPPTFIFALPSRPSFTGGGTDQYNYCFVVWDTSDRYNATNWIWLDNRGIVNK